MYNTHLGEGECWVLGCILELRLEILRREVESCGFRMKKVGRGLSFFFLTFKVLKYGLKSMFSNVIAKSEIRYDIKETQKCADILFVL